MIFYRDLEIYRDRDFGLNRYRDRDFGLNRYRDRDLDPPFDPLIPANEIG